MTDTEKQWLPRALAGGIAGVALLLAFEYVWDAMPWTGHVWNFGNPFQVWKDWFQDADFLPFPWANVCLCFLMGAEVGAEGFQIPDGAGPAHDSDRPTVQAFAIGKDGGDGDAFHIRSLNS